MLDIIEKEGVVGNYRIIRQMGRGGMGVVYEVESIDNGKHFALKVFTSDGTHSDFLRKRFIAEGKLLSRLNHSHLVKVYEVSIDEVTKSPFFIMDLVLSENGEPCTLEVYRRQGRLDERQIALIYADLRDALIYLHGEGVVHRDIKLENVLIGADGRAILSDFGVSRIFRSELREAISVTTTFVSDRVPIMGSAGYLSPELKAGASATPSDDAWALGVLVFRLLTGVWYEADSQAMEFIAGFDPEWQQLLEKLLNANPKKRIPLAAPPKLCSDNSLLFKYIKGFKGRVYILVILFVLVVVGCWAALSRFVSSEKYSFDEFFPASEGVNIR